MSTFTKKTLEAAAKINARYLEARMQDAIKLGLSPSQDHPCAKLPINLRAENGGGFVCIWRKKDDPLNDGSDCARKCTVDDWLSIASNCCGEWYIDGGWGGPPGPIKVRWDDVAKQWINCGFPPWN